MCLIDEWWILTSSAGRPLQLQFTEPWEDMCASVPLQFTEVWEDRCPSVPLQFTETWET